MDKGLALDLKPKGDVGFKAFCKGSPAVRSFSRGGGVTHIRNLVCVASAMCFLLRLAEDVRLLRGLTV